MEWRVKLYCKEWLRVLDTMRAGGVKTDIREFGLCTAAAWGEALTAVCKSRPLARRRKCINARGERFLIIFFLAI